MGFVKVSCNQGINQQEDLANKDQCRDAQNVWAPNGRVIERPGFAIAGDGAYSTTATPAVTAVITEDISTGIFVHGANANIAGFGDGDNYYLGVAAPPTAPLRVVAVSLVPLAATNIAAIIAVPTYWNGAGWANLPSEEAMFSGGSWLRAPIHAATNPSYLQLPVPLDWAKTTVDGTSAYFVKITLRAKTAGATVTAGVVLAPTIVSYDVPMNMRGLFAPLFQSSKVYLASVADTTGYVYIFSGFSFPDFSFPGTAVALALAGSSSVASVAVVPTFGEAFIFVDGIGATVKPNGSITLNPTVETSDWAIGPGAPFDITTLAQEAAFPQPKFISYFGGRLWAANLAEDPTMIRWSMADGAVPGHRTWPSISFERVPEPITAMMPLGENMIVYTALGIYLMQYVGDTDFGTLEFVPKRVVAGKGCVAPNSLKQIRGKHYFLAADGLYAFDGTPDLKKVTEGVGTDGSTVDRLADLMSTISEGQRQNAAAAHWEEKRLYLLTVSTDGYTASNVAGNLTMAANNTTIVYDYEHNTLWRWSGINAQYWLEDGRNLFFADSYGRAFKLNEGTTDNGAAIDAWFETNTFARLDAAQQHFHGVDMTCSNITRTVTFESLVDSNHESSTDDLSFIDRNESKVGTAIVGTSKLMPKHTRARRKLFDDCGEFFRFIVTKKLGFFEFAGMVLSIETKWKRLLG